MTIFYANLCSVILLHNVECNFSVTVKCTCAVFTNAVYPQLLGIVYCSSTIRVNVERFDHFQLHSALLTALKMITGICYNAWYRYRISTSALFDVQIEVGGYLIRNCLEHWQTFCRNKQAVQCSSVLIMETGKVL